MSVGCGFWLVDDHELKVTVTEVASKGLLSVLLKRRYKMVIVSYGTFGFLCTLSWVQSPLNFVFCSV